MAKRITRIFGIIILLSMLYEVSAKTKLDVEERINEFIEAMMQYGEVHGLSLGVVMDGEVSAR